MYSKLLIWIGVLVGSTLGGAIPSVLGADIFSLWGVIGSAVGGLVGIWVAVKLSG
jgi:hypothetical protein